MMQPVGQRFTQKNLAQAERASLYLLSFKARREAKKPGSSKRQRITLRLFSQVLRCGGLASSWRGLSSTRSGVGASTPQDCSLQKCYYNFLFISACKWDYNCTHFPSTLAVTDLTSWRPSSLGSDWQSTQPGNSLCSQDDPSRDVLSPTGHELQHSPEKNSASAVQIRQDLVLEQAEQPGRQAEHTLIERKLPAGQNLEQHPNLQQQQPETQDMQLVVPLKPLHRIQPQGQAEQDLVTLQKPFGQEGVHEGLKYCTTQVIQLLGLVQELQPGEQGRHRCALAQVPAGQAEMQLLCRRNVLVMQVRQLELLPSQHVAQEEKQIPQILPLLSRNQLALQLLLALQTPFERESSPKQLMHELREEQVLHWTGQLVHMPELQKKVGGQLSKQFPFSLNELAAQVLHRSAVMHDSHVGGQFALHPESEKKNEGQVLLRVHCPWLILNPGRQPVQVSKLEVMPQLWQVDGQLLQVKPFRYVLVGQLATQLLVAESQTVLEQQKALTSIATLRGNLLQVLRQELASRGQGLQVRYLATPVEVQQTRRQSYTNFKLTGFYCCRVAANCACPCVIKQS